MIAVVVILLIVLIYFYIESNKCANSVKDVKKKIDGLELEIKTIEVLPRSTLSVLDSAKKCLNDMKLNLTLMDASLEGLKAYSDKATVLEKAITEYTNDATLSKAMIEAGCTVQPTPTNDTLGKAKQCLADRLEFVTKARFAGGLEGYNTMSNNLKLAIDNYSGDDSALQKVMDDAEC